MHAESIYHDCIVDFVLTFICCLVYIYTLDFFSRHTARMCSNPADIIFILDESRSIWGPDFDREKEFVKKVVKLFDPTVSRFGVETFSVGADIKFHLGDFTKQEDVLDAIDKIQQVSLARTIRIYALCDTLSLSKCVEIYTVSPVAAGGGGTI